MVVLTSCGENKAVKMIKSATLAEFPTAVIGEAFDSVYQQPEWSAIRNNGKTSVWCKGTVLYADEPSRSFSVMAYLFCFFVAVNKFYGFTPFL